MMVMLTKMCNVAKAKKKIFLSKEKQGQGQGQGLFSLFPVNISSLPSFQTNVITDFACSTPSISEV